MVVGCARHGQQCSHEAQNVIKSVYFCRGKTPKQNAKQADAQRPVVADALAGYSKGVTPVSRDFGYQPGGRTAIEE